LKTLQIEIPDEVIELLGLEGAKSEAKVALVLDLVRQRTISKAKAAEMLGMNLVELPSLLSKYQIPWFEYDKDELENDLKLLETIK
jgi:predicted HTH domain antitoxin